MTPNARIAFLLPVPGQLHPALAENREQCLDVYITITMTAILMRTREKNQCYQQHNLQL